MGDPKRRERGLEMINKVYAGDVVTPPEGQSVFSDLMLEQLWAEMWSREELSIRDRRFLIIGAIVALGEAMPFGIQIRAALKNGEINATEAREILVTLAQYAGYPRCAGLVAPLEQAIAEFEKNQG